MHDVELFPLQETDLGFVCEVRHHIETLSNLHDDRVFSLDDARRWFRETEPDWHLITHQGIKVGYIRTSERDEHNLSLKIGADIHPDHRRQGYATAAYTTLISQLRNEGWRRIWLEVLPHNRPAIALYEKLDFRTEGCKSAAVLRNGMRYDSILMSQVFEDDTNVNAKVIAAYFGNRRSPPRNPREAYSLLQFMLDKEQTVDPGCPTDTILVCNRAESPTDNGSAEWLNRCEERLQQADGQSTRRGKMRVLMRENIGLSFGAYNYAFSLFSGHYDYWLFTEDDQVMVADDYYRRAIEQLDADSSVGFVAIVGVSTKSQHPPHAHGGVGVTSRRILRQVKATNICSRHPEGQLPYHIGPGYENQERLGEIQFTNAIHSLGYRLINHPLQQICIAWGQKKQRTPRMVPWSEHLTYREDLTCPSNVSP